MNLRDLYDAYTSLSGDIVTLTEDELKKSLHLSTKNSKQLIDKMVADKKIYRIYEEPHASLPTANYSPRYGLSEKVVRMVRKDVAPGIWIDLFKQEIHYPEGAKDLLDYEPITQKLMSRLKNQGLVVKSLRYHSAGSNKSMFEFECFPAKIHDFEKEYKIAFNIQGKTAKELERMAQIIEGKGAIETGSHFRSWARHLHTLSPVEDAYRTLEAAYTQYPDLDILHKISELDQSAAHASMPTKTTKHHFNYKFNSDSRTIELMTSVRYEKKLLKQIIHEASILYGPMKQVGSFICKRTLGAFAIGMTYSNIANANDKVTEAVKEGTLFGMSAMGLMAGLSGAATGGATIAAGFTAELINYMIPDSIRQRMMIHVDYDQVMKLASRLAAVDEFSYSPWSYQPPNAPLDHTIVEPDEFMPKMTPAVKQTMTPMPAFDKNKPSFWKKAAGNTMTLAPKGGFSATVEHLQKQIPQQDTVNSIVERIAGNEASASSYVNQRLAWSTNLNFELVDSVCDWAITEDVATANSSVIDEKVSASRSMNDLKVEHERILQQHGIIQNRSDFRVTTSTQTLYGTKSFHEHMQQVINPTPNSTRFFDKVALGNAKEPWLAVRSMGYTGGSAGYELNNLANNVGGNTRVQGMYRNAKF